MNEQQVKLARFYWKCRKDFVFAAKALLGIELWWGQELMLRAMMNSKFVMCVAGRGLGKTFIMALYSVLVAMLKPNHKVGIVSYSFRQAKFVFIEIQKLYNKSPLFRKCCVKAPVIGSESCYMMLKNGSVIMALPLGDGEKIRGFRANTMIVDEAVKIPGEIFELVILPFMNVAKDPMKKVENVRLRREAIERGETPPDEDTESNQVIMATTAWFQCSYLYQHYRTWKEQQELGDKDHSVVSLTYLDAPEGYLDMKILELTKRTCSAIRFAMENLAYWPPDTDGFFPRSIFEGARGNFQVESRGTKGGYYVIAVDMAREQDNIVIMTSKVDFLKQRNKIVFVKTIKPSMINEPNGFKVIHREVREVIRSFNTNGSFVVRLCVDSGGGGGTLRDMLAEPFTYEDKDSKEITEPPIFQIEGQEELHDKIFKTLYNDDNKMKPLRILDFVHWNTDWLNKTAYDLRFLLESRGLLIPIPRVDGDKKESADTKDAIDVRDVIYDEIEETIDESTNVIGEELPSQGGKLRFRTSKESLKKDRWAALMMTAYGIKSILKELKVPEKHIVDEGVGMSSSELFLSNMPNENTMPSLSPFHTNHSFPTHSMEIESPLDFTEDVRWSEGAALR